LSDDVAIGIGPIVVELIANEAELDSGTIRLYLGLPSWSSRDGVGAEGE
jgi:hypothetical protein